MKAPVIQVIGAQSFWIHPFQYAMLFNPTAISDAPVYAPVSATSCSATRLLTAWPTSTTTAAKSDSANTVDITSGVDCPASRLPRIVALLAHVLDDVGRESADAQAAIRNVVEDRYAERHLVGNGQLLAVPVLPVQDEPGHVVPAAAPPLQSTHDFPGREPSRLQAPVERDVNVDLADDRDVDRPRLRRPDHDGARGGERREVHPG